MNFIRKAASAWAKTFGSREYAMIIGLGLLAYGMSLIWFPGAFLVPGAILAGVAVFGVR